MSSLHPPEGNRASCSAAPQMCPVGDSASKIQLGPFCPSASGLNFPHDLWAAWCPPGRCTVLKGWTAYHGAEPMLPCSELLTPPPPPSIPQDWESREAEALGTLCLWRCPYILAQAESLSPPPCAPGLTSKGPSGPRRQRQADQDEQDGNQ